MSWGHFCRSFALLVLTFAVSDFSTAQSLNATHNLQPVSSRPIGAAQRPDAITVVSPLAAYSDITTFAGQGFIHGGAAVIGANTFTRLAADDLNLVGTPPFSATGFSFSVANLNAVAVSVRPRVRFYRADGAGGAPGTLITGFNFNAVTVPATTVLSFTATAAFAIPAANIWAGMTFDNNSGATGATLAQMNQVGQGIYTPPDVGTSADLVFRTTAAGDFLASNPAGATLNLGGAPTANFGWEIRVAQNLDLSITKDDGVTSATPGGSVVYTIVASNAGPGNAVDATVTDAFPAGLTCNWTCAGSGAGNNCAASGSGNISDATVDILPSGSVTYTATCAISGAATGTLSNIATITGGTGVVDTNAANNSATDVDTLAGGAADLGITKTDGVTTATAGGSVTYTINASNAGPSSVTGATVADTFPAPLTCTWTCVGAGGGTCPASGSGNINSTVNLPAGGSVEYTASCTVSPSASGTLSNTATVAAPAGFSDPNPANNSATDSDTLGASANLSITKTDGVTTATAGGSTTYTITASNAGPSNATGATVSDTFPAALTCTYTCTGAGGGTCTAAGSGNINDTVNLPAGGSTIYVASCTISAAATGTLSNTATVTAPAGVTDPTPGNNSATDNDTLGASADLAITKTDGVTTATPGGSTTYTITASNSGPSSVTDATVADTFPASLTCTWTCTGAGGGTCTASGSGNINNTVNLPAGSSVVYVASCTISGAATGTLSNTATVTAPAGVTDPTPGNNSATDSDTLGASADLSITKTDGVTTATPGGNVTYTITASNAGPSNARPEGANRPDGFTASIVTDTFPASLTCTWTCVGAAGGTCAASGAGNINAPVTLPAGGSVTFTASCAISGAATGTLSNTATVTTGSGATDPNPANNSATDTDTLGASTDLSITKTDNVASVTAGTNTTYTIVASNAGPSAATGATVSDTFPASLTCTWTCAGTSGGTCTASGSGNLNDTVNLPSGGSVTYTASCAISSAATGTISNTATVTASATDPNSKNNAATDSDTVSPAAAASVTGTKTASGTFAPGSTITYTIVLGNSGTGAQADNPGNELTDVLPASLVLVGATSSSGTAVATTATNTVTWNGAIPAGGSVTILITATVAPTATPGSTVSNQGIIATDLDGNGTNEATRTTDDPATQAPGDSTSFVVLGGVAPATPIISIPTLGTWGLALLALLLAGFATMHARKRT